MRKRGSVFLMGVILLVLWISLIPYLFERPLYPTPGIQRLSQDLSDFPDWLKDQAGLTGKSQHDIQSELVTFCRIEFAKSALLYLLGILSGILILKRRISGRFLAIGLSIFVLLLRIIDIAFWLHPLRLHLKYTVFFPRYSFWVIHVDIVMPLVLLVALVYLLRPSIAKRFEKNKSDESMAIE